MARDTGPGFPFATLRGAVLLLMAACGPEARQAPILETAGTSALMLAVPPMRLTTDPYFLGGRASSVTITGANPGDVVKLLRSPTIGGVPLCPPLIAPDCLDLALPVAIVGSAVADSDGVAVMSYTSADPPANPEVQLQAVVVGAGGGKLSDAPIIEMYGTASDTDGDGLPDPLETDFGTDILDADSDGDTVSDGAEVMLYGTDPTRDETDCMGFPDQVLTTEPAWVDAMSVADLDGDGDADLMTASSVDDEVAWHENRGAGIMRHPNAIGTTSGGIPKHMEGTDLDGDGDLDILLTWSSTAPMVGWYENLGAGAFAPRQEIGSGFTDPWDTGAADLDGDGDLDVLVALGSNDTISWYENLGAGAYGLSQDVTTTVNFAISVATGDLDGDGDPDVLAGGYSGDLTWYENLGAGSFSSTTLIIHELVNVLDVETGDLDGDGDVDVVATTTSSDTVFWYENDGVGNFTVHSFGINLPMGEDVVVADLDGDADLDVAAVGRLQRTKVVWFENLGAEGFAPNKTLYDEGSPGEIIVSGDLDGDGDDDLVTAFDNLSTATVVGLKNLGTPLDLDGDGLVRGAEVCITGTDPARVDTDGGGVDDGVEVEALTDPLDAQDG